MIDLVLIFVAVLCTFYLWSSLRHKGMPPGPGLALPLIGHLHLLESDPTEQFIKWRKRLGDVFTVQYGYKKVVFLCGHGAIHDALVKQHHNFMNRTDSFLHSVLFNSRGVISLAGEEWKEHRSFLQQTLKNLGLGRNVMAERIHREIEHLLKELSDSEGKPMQLRPLLSASMCNVIALVTFGRRRDYKDHNFMEMQNLTMRGFELASPSNPVHFFHRLIRFLPVNLFYYRELMDYVNAMKKNIANLVNETVCDGLEGDVCIVSEYKAEMNKSRLAGRAFTSMSEENLLYTCWNFFNAGTETTSTTILYGILYLVIHPDIQEKLFQEIKDNVGTDHLPPWDCKQRLVQLNAFILETQRLSSIIPLSLDRNTEQDATIRGYFIPKGTIVIPILDSALWDENAWDDPMSFRPERFIENGALTVKKDFVPFSLGRRNCLGEPLAVMELFLFLSALIQRFQFLPEDPGKMPSVGGCFGFSRIPHPFKVRVVPRH